MIKTKWNIMKAKRARFELQAKTKWIKLNQNWKKKKKKIQIFNKHFMRITEYSRSTSISLPPWLVVSLFKFKLLHSFYSFISLLNLVKCSGTSSSTVTALLISTVVDVIIFVVVVCIHRCQLLPQYRYYSFHFQSLNTQTTSQ